MSDTRFSVIPARRLEAHLSAIAEDGRLRRRSAQAKLLAYLVEKEAGGVPDDFKPDVIAGRVFDAEATGGARLVAVTAHRLRRTLRQFHESRQDGDTLVVSLPRGGYRLRIDDAKDPRPGPQMMASSPAIPQETFFRFLTSLTKEMPEEEQCRRIAIWAATSSRFSDLQFPMNGGVERLRVALRSTGNELSFWDMSALTKELGVHPILLDPLSATAVKSDCIRLQLPLRQSDGYRLPSSSVPSAGDPSTVIGAFVRVGRPYDKGYGDHVQYAVADHRIDGTDAAFVSLVLEPNGCTDDHHHPGDELMFVLAGVVRICLRNSGVEFDLASHSFVHFYAEQSHSVRNSSPTETAHVFIIRFYQFQDEPSASSSRPLPRQAMNGLLQKEIARLGPEPSPATKTLPVDESAARQPKALEGLRRAAGWMISPIAEHAVDHNVPSRVLNPLGLARFIRRLVAPAPDRADKLIEALDRTRACQSLADWLWEVETDQREVPRELIPLLSSTFGVTELPLLYEFLFPSFRREVVVKRDELRFWRADWVNMADVTGNAHEGRSSEGALYEVPRRSLSCSDISIAWLTLDPDRSTPWNTHVGCECALVLEGHVSIEFDGPDNTACQLTALAHVGHYNSLRRHRVRNTTQRRAQVLLIRFYGEKPTLSTSPPRPESNRAKRPVSTTKYDDRALW